MMYGLQAVARRIEVAKYCEGYHVDDHKFRGRNNGLHWDSGIPIGAVNIAMLFNHHFCCEEDLNNSNWCVSPFR